MGMGASVVGPAGIGSTNRVSLEVCLSFTQGVKLGSEAGNVELK